MKNWGKKLLLFFYCLVIMLIIFALRWSFIRFEFSNFDEVLFQLTTSISTVESSVLKSLVIDCFLPTIVGSVLLFLILYYLFSYLQKKDSIWKIKTKVFKTCLKGIMLCCFLFVVYYSLEKVTFWDYLSATIHKSNYIEEHYVDPQSVKMIFPEKKRNLIYIYVESFESSFFSKELGGSADENWISPLTDLTKEYLNFSDTDKFGGAKSIPGTTWTSGALVAQTSGLPLKVTNPLSLRKVDFGMIPHAYTLTDLLHDQGYQQMFMIGSSKIFGIRGDYFENHGNVVVYDYDTAKEKGKIADDYYEWWGFEDEKLFTFAKEEISNLSSSSEPFHFMLLTANTHTKDGYLEKDCEQLFSQEYANSLYCSSDQIKQFVEWIQKQPFYENTTIVIAGDHLSMQPGLLDKGSKRRVYDLYINSPVSTGNYINREFSTLDLFPTTVASLGVRIEGDRLGLGTNLFSNQKTLMEEDGYDKFVHDTYLNSDYYWKKFY